MRYGKLIVGLWTVATLGCYAQFQHDPLYDGEPEQALVPLSPRTLRDAKLCLENNPEGCVVLQVENRNFYEAVLYLNGRRLGQVTGLSKSPPIFVPGSVLSGGRCAQMVVRLVGPPMAWQSGKECLTPGGHFGLLIAWEFSTTSLTPWS